MGRGDGTRMCFQLSSDKDLSDALLMSSIWRLASCSLAKMSCAHFVLNFGDVSELSAEAAGEFGVSICSCIFRIFAREIPQGI